MNVPSVVQNIKALARFSPDQVDLIKRTVAQGTTDTELELFLYQCQRTGLDPLARQIYAVKRWQWDARQGKNVEIMSIQTAIDGFRLIAERTGKYAGQLGPEWCGEDGIWRDVWISKDPPAAARVAALRSDFQQPLWGIARFDTYAQRTKEGKLTRAWLTMGDLMNAKCAEALALRRAFPHELSGLYTSDEMASVPQPEIEPETKQEPAKQENPIKPQEKMNPLDLSNLPTNERGEINWRAFGEMLANDLRGAKSIEETDVMLEKALACLETMQKDAPKMHASLRRTISKIRLALDGEAK